MKKIIGLEQIKKRRKLLGNYIIIIIRLEKNVLSKFVFSILRAILNKKKIARLFYIKAEKIYISSEI